MTQYFRHTSGRLRMTWPQLKNDLERAKAAEAEILRIGGVLSARASALTGNVFIRYDARWIELNALLASVQQTMWEIGLARPVPAGPISRSRRPTHGSLSASSDILGHKLGDMLVNMLVEKAVERLGIALVAAVL